MGFKDKLKKAKEDGSLYEFRPSDLNEGNVQAIFNRCLAKPDSKETASSILFSSLMGFSKKDVRIIRFDKEELLANRKIIEYLYGQLKAVHTSGGENVKLPIVDMVMLYSDNSWTTEVDILFKLGYLGVAPETALINPVLAKDKSTVISKEVKPTLSPKDPAFPAWWEEHKSEWEV